MKVLPQALNLGPFKATWVWRTEPDAAGTPRRIGSIPAALLVEHLDHTVLVPWAHYEGGPAPTDALFTLNSLVPLTVVEDISCPTCGRVGRIRDGRWVVVAGGGGRG